MLYLSSYVPSIFLVYGPFLGVPVGQSLYMGKHVDSGVPMDGDDGLLHMSVCVSTQRHPQAPPKKGAHILTVLIICINCIKY